MSTISAGTTSGSALVNSGDTTGNLVFQTNGTTTALTLNTSQNATFAGDVSVTGAISSTAGFSSPLAVKGNSTAGAEIRLPEDTDNGSNYVALKAANSIASNVTFTLPDADGTSGQVLQTNGSGTLSFATPAGGSWTYLSTVTASNSATMDIETTFSSTYDSYAIVVNDIIPATDNDTFWVRLKINGSYQTASYGYIVNRQSSASGTFDVTRSAQAASRIISAENVGNAAGETISGIMYVFVPASTTAFKSVYGTWTQVTSAGNAAQNLFTGYYSGSNATAALTGVRLMLENGNITSGTARLYGIKNS